MNYIQIVVFLYIILRVTSFFVTIIGGHNCSYSAILMLFLQIQLYDTISLSHLHVHWILCYRIKIISFIVLIKQLKSRIFVQCKYCYTTGAFPFKVTVVGSIPLPGTASFFLPFFSSISFFASLTPTVLCVYPGVFSSVGRVLRVCLAGLLTIDFDHNHSCGPILDIW